MSSRIIEMDEGAVKRAYARWAPVYDVTFGRIAEAGRNRTVEHINQFEGRVLEVGVGTGISLPHYNRRLKITGIDLSPEMLKKARRRVVRDRLNHVEAILEMDASDLRFEDDSFDVVVAMYVLTVVPDPIQVMRELERVCQPGGQVIVVNHFSQDHGVRGVVEKAMGRFGEALGWRPEFPVATLMVCDRLKLVESQPMRPFGLFTIMRFVKDGPEGAGSTVDYWLHRQAASAPRSRASA